MRGALIILVAGILLAMLLSAIAFGAQAEECDTQLVLAVDVSGSVSDSNFRLQMDGVAQALGDRRVIRAAMSGPKRCVDLAVLEWSDTAQPMTPFLRVSSPGSAQEAASVIASLPRVSAGSTGLYAAVKAAYDLFTCQACRRVIDVSGDGQNNMPSKHSLIVSDLANEGVTVNGLAIISDEPTVADWYREHVRTPDGFVITVDGFGRFAEGMRRKLEAEIAGLKPVTQVAGQ